MGYFEEGYLSSIVSLNMTDKKKSPKKEYLIYAGLGFEILACILLFSGLGYVLDRWLENEQPWFLLFLSLIGCALAIYLLVKHANQMNKRK